MRKHQVLLGILLIFILFIMFTGGIYLITWLSKDDKRMSFGDKVAVVEIKGIIIDSRNIIEQIIKYRKNNSVKALVLRIDTPGGAVGPSQEIYQEVLKTKKEKKVVASMGTVAASGGYYIACGVDKIIANPGTITGSIGVKMEFGNVEELLKKIGLKGGIVKSGKYKDIGSPLRDMSKDERELIQGVVDDIYWQFVDAIVLNRKLPKEKVVSIADGRFFSGSQAKKYGLVDELGNLQDSIIIAANISGIKGEPDVIYPEKKKINFLDTFMEEAMTMLEKKIYEKMISITY